MNKRCLPEKRQSPGTSARVAGPRAGGKIDGPVIHHPMTNADPANLEFTSEEMRAMGEATLARVIDHIASLPAQPACGDVDAADLCRSLREPPPEKEAALEPLLAQLFDQWVPRSFTASGPGYLAYIPGGGLFPAALADLIADATNRFTGIWQAAPALVQLEANVLDWLRDWMGFPPGTRGLLTSGGSLANFNAIVCARERKLQAEIRRGVLYASSQVHGSVEKAARMAGIHADRIHTVPVDGDFRMRVDALAEAVAADRARGLLPFLVVASAGTTNTGAVDPMDAVADLRARDGLWMHVDGAYGAFFHLCEKLRPLLPGMSRADSLTLDPHKGLFLPYGTGALLVRDGDEGQGDLTPRLCQPCRFLCKGQLTAERADRWSPEPQPGEVRFYKKHVSTRAHDVPTSSLSQSP